MRSSDSYVIELLMERIELLAKEIAARTPVRVTAPAPIAIPIPALAYPMKWVKLDRYVELSGDTADSVQSRRKAGKWLDGEQCKIVDGRLWINLQAVDGWVEAWDARAPMLAAGGALLKKKK